MKLSNATDEEVFYSISAPGAADCGTISPQSEKEVGYDNLAEVKVSFVATNKYKNYEIDVPETGAGNVATIALNFS